MSESCSSDASDDGFSSYDNTTDGNDMKGGGGGGGNNSGNNKKDSEMKELEEYLDFVINTWIKGIFGKNVVKVINDIKAQGRIVISETINGEVFSNPKYNPSDKKIYLPTEKYTDVLLMHELVHYAQDEIGALNYDQCSSNNEFEAYALTYMLYNFSLKLDQPDKDQDAPMPTLHGEKLWIDFNAAIKGHINMMDSTFCYDQQFVEQLSKCSWPEFAEKFRDYYAARQTPKGYYKNYDENYIYNWTKLLEILGIKEKNK